MPHYSFLDILRGIAILGVLLVHLPYLGGIDTPHWFEIGKIAVPLFFILSSYTLCLSQNAKPTTSRKEFFKRRFFRIYPLFALVIVYIFLLQTLETTFMLGKFDIYTLWDYLGKLTFLYGFFPEMTNNFFLGEWTLFNEFLFYLSFPLLFPTLRKSRKATAGFLLFSVMLHYAWRYGWGIYKQSFAVLPGYIRDYEAYAFPYHLVDFAAGFPMFHLHQWFFDKKISNILLSGFSILVGGVLLYMAWLRFHDIQLDHIAVVATLMGGIFVVMQGRDFFHGLGSKVLQYIAKLSYSLYLLNLPVMVLIYHYSPLLGIYVGWKKVALFGVSIFLVSWLSYRFETWGVGVGKR